jgi:alkanesulfonate monooxygenase
MPVEIIGGMLTPYEGNELSMVQGPEVFDASYITRFAQAHEAAGYDCALTGYGATSADGFAIASHALHVTEKFKVLVAHRPGFAQPTLVARQVATLDNLTGGGRIAVHFITGGDEADQHRDGDYLDHDDRYRRTAEYMALFRRTLTEAQPFDFSGEFYHFEGAFSRVKPKAVIPLYFGGASGPALEAGAANADVYMLWGEPVHAIAERISAIREASARHGRTPRFSLSIRGILGDTEDAAWNRAQDIAQRTEERAKSASGGRIRRRASSSVGAARLQAFAQEGEVLDERLWTRIAAITGAGGNSTALVGTAEQVTKSLLAYYDLGCTTILIRGFDPMEDVIEYGRELIPRLRAATADR